MEPCRRCAGFDEEEGPYLRGAIGSSQDIPTGAGAVFMGLNSESARSGRAWNTGLDKGEFVDLGVLS